MRARAALRFPVLLLAGFALAAVFASGAQAQLPGGGGAPGTATSDACPPGQVCLENPLNVSRVPDLVANILKGAISIVGALALLVFFYGGITWLTSRGEAAKITEAKEMMKWAAIGLVIIFTSYGLVNFVFSAITG